jgi:tRNA(fMet)-specific endonuclease VapC
VALRLALDTNRYRDLTDGVAQVIERLQVADTVYVPFVVLAELRAGFAVGRRGEHNERTLQRFLAKPGIEVLFPDDATTRAYAGVFRQLRKQGTPLPTNDLWIAALVIQHNLVLYTRDRHFDSLPQLDIV